MVSFLDLCFAVCFFTNGYLITERQPAYVSRCPSLNTLMISLLDEENNTYFRIQEFDKDKNNRAI